MVHSHYCPICSTFLPDPTVERCHRCGVDIAGEWERRLRYEGENRRKSELVQGPFHAVTGLSCPLCGERVEVQSVTREEFVVDGEKVGNGPAGCEKALTRLRVYYRAWRCQKGHRLFSSFEAEWKELCPRCRSPNNPYGVLVRSCPKCNVMVPVDYYQKDDPIILMEGRGIHYAPELEGG